MIRPVRVAIIYYSQTGNVYRMAEAVAEGAEKAGAEVRLRSVAELAPAEAIASNARWQAHLEETQHVVTATVDDLAWADAVVFGTPTRYGTPTAQIKQFIDGTGPLWQQGKLSNKVYSVFVSAGTRHGGLESTALALANVFYHWGGYIVPPGYTDPVQFALGNPYAPSHVSASGLPDDVALNSSRYLGRRVTEAAAALVVR